MHYQSKLKLILIFAIGLSLPFPAIAYPQKSKMPLGEFKVKVLKRRQAHIKTAALLCALQENGASKSQIQEAWREWLKVPISEDDQFLVRSVMSGMCPAIKPQKFVLN